uniref:NADH-ubiquinone oxidoreductase chain 2 n=1 Tax=Omosita colon TaxID=878176 RepID=A0A7H1DJM0_9CUCU|nr:NADH dehydrogenase subunit 2 [Omosita colon]QNS37162.1 NADH dehydrogenase subunit 2 [Omosita colon]QVG61286.1 NADH dehydrogenase subunit 2 [Omosita colon]
MKFYKILFINSMIFGTLLSISSFSWFSMWMGLEINLLSIIPLLNSSKNIYPSEAAIKYFITQAMASSIIMLAIILYLNILEFIPQDSKIYLNIMMNSGLMIKLGAAPFHFWFPEVMEGLNWNFCLIMLTWQKIAPMILIMNNIYFNMFTYTVIITCSLISGIQGINQISLRKILTYSSINHIGWMLASMLYSHSIWFLYFLIYSIISINIILIFNSMNIFYLKQLINTMNYNKLLKMLFSLNFLSLGGLPPFLGFLPKWLTINYLINNNLYILSTILIISTLVTLYFYLRITFNSLMMYSSENLNHNFKMNNFVIIFNLISISGLIMCTFILNF